MRTFWFSDTQITIKILKYKGQKVAVLGCGRSGQAAAHLASREGAQVSIFDEGCSDKVQAAVERLQEQGCQSFTGSEALKGNVEDFQLAVLSPGIAPGLRTAS